MSEAAIRAVPSLDALTRSGQAGVLRFITCGSVDDGKSTLIGRLLYDSKRLFDDQIAALERDTERHGTTDGESLDFALLLDGLEAEREQGITIDVAYRFFATEKRKFIVADTPGHEQYTRNMATGASTADLAVILVDARKGILTQTKRHTFIAHLLGIRHVVLAVNKMDLVEHSRARFHEVVAEYVKVSDALGFASVVPIPMSARFGDNVTTRSETMSWFDGPTLIEHLENVEIGARGNADAAAFRMPVQWVNRPNLDFRGYSGEVIAGTIAQGDEVVVAGSGARSKVARIATADADLKTAAAGDAVTIALEDEVDIARGDVLVDPKARPDVSNQFSAHVLWMNENALLPGRSYLLKTGASTTPVSITQLAHKIDVNTFEHAEGRTLELNEIGLCKLETARPIVFDPYRDNRDMGGFIIIDRYSYQTVGAGMIEQSLRRADNVHLHRHDVDKAQRSGQKEQRAAILWFTGLSGSGKSTIANLVDRKLTSMGKHTYVLDGDNIRHGLNKDLGFTEIDRVENIRRIGEVAKLFVDAGLIVICSFISPYRNERRMVRELVEDDEYVEIFVDTPFDVCAERDPKGLYAKALAGEIKNFTGLDSPYETPVNPELHVDGSQADPETHADAIIDELRRRGIIWEMSGLGL
ncbi:MAG: sulfate adenylyltransferase subunit CysN [Maricaulaceae bacterium]|jgi:bifunctional enzyme CysN/CysC